MDYENLVDTYEAAKENLELFEASIGTGILYADHAGTILRMMLRVDGEIASNSMLFTYSNPEEMTITVSVDQSDIAKLSVGDTALIQSTSSPMCQGIIREITPISTSTSRTSVTYSVTVIVTENTASLSTNETVTVMFGMGGN